MPIKMIRHTFQFALPHHWVVGGVSAAIILALNLLFPLSTSNDFPGLGQNCELIEQYGIKYAVNSNWGFAHTAAVYAVAQATGSLLLAQRIINGIFVLLTLFLLQRIAFVQLKIATSWVVTGAFIILLSSYLFADMTLSPHLDIAPITLLLVAIRRLDLKTDVPTFFTGIVIGIAFWFRFHFLVPALLFPALVFFHSSDRRFRRAVLSAGGVFSAVSVPYMLTKIGFGVWSISNQKALLGEMIYGENWDCDFQWNLQNIAWQQLGADFSFIASLRRFVIDFTYHTEMFVPFLMLLTFLIAEVYTQKHTAQRSQPHTSAIVLLYLAVSILPLIFIRTSTTRLMAMFLIPAFPFLLGIVLRHGRIYGGMALVLLLTFAWRNVSQYADMRERQVKLRADIQLAEQYIPARVLAKSSHKVLATKDFFNPHSKYNIASPVLTYAWPCRYKPFRDKFGIVRINELYTPPAHFDFLIFSHSPNDSLFVYDAQLLSQNYQFMGENKYGTTVWKRKNLVQ